MLQKVFRTAFDTCLTTFAENNKVRITPRHIMFGIKQDDELGKLLKDVHIAGGGTLPNIHPLLFRDVEEKRTIVVGVERSSGKLIERSKRYVLSKTSQDE
jgi:hypothetical protein